MKHPVTDLKKWLVIAEEAARRSGRFLAQAGKGSRRLKADYGKEVKISADTQSEKIIVDFLKSKSYFPILTEESGVLGGNIKDGPFWVVDPLDGSLNFWRDIPLSCISIALWEKRNPIIGVIYDFNKNELFTGIVGKGAWLNKRPISASRVKVKKKAILFTGIPVKAGASRSVSKLLLSQVSRYRKARWLGSAALCLAYVASGRGDAYLEKGIMLWDIAAGLAIVKAAGGRYHLKRAKKDNICCAYAANRFLINKESRLS